MAVISSPASESSTERSSEATVSSSFGSASLPRLVSLPRIRAVSEQKTSTVGNSMDVEAVGVVVVERVAVVNGGGSQALKAEDDATCEQVAAGLSCCCPIVGCVTFCISAANNKEGSQKRKWGNIACAVGTCSLLAAVAFQMYRMS